VHTVKILAVSMNILSSDNIDLMILSLLGQASPEGAYFYFDSSVFDHQSFNTFPCIYW
jgi:hypothetical protein